MAPYYFCNGTMRGMTAGEVQRTCYEAGFELAGVARAQPSSDISRYQDWANRGLAGEMKYLTDHRRP